LPENTISFDIEPRNDNTIKQDYLLWKPKDETKYIVFGNPPFGLRGQTALKFIKHSFQFADYVCFILPQMFNSDGKGVPKNRLNDYSLLLSIPIENEFYQPDSKIIKINVIFQIWSKKSYCNDTTKMIKNDSLKIYSLSDGGTPSSTRNKKMIDNCDIYLSSTCFDKQNIKIYKSFYDLPNQKGYGVVFVNKKEYYTKLVKEPSFIDFLKEHYFQSTNSAYNIRSSLINKVFNDFCL